MLLGNGRSQSKDKIDSRLHPISLSTVLIVLAMLISVVTSMIVPPSQPLPPHGIPLPPPPPPPSSPLTSYSTHELTNLTTRDRPPPCIKRVEKVGNGDPHPSCKFHQVTGNLDCNHQDCQSSHAEGRTFSWSVGSEGGGEGKGGIFSSLGFDVSESYSSENTYSCSPKDGHQKICVIAVVSYLEYTGREVDTLGGCLNNVHTTPYVIRAPTKGNRQNFRCEVDAGCVALDHEVWEHNGKACP